MDITHTPPPYAPANLSPGAIRPQKKQKISDTQNSNVMIPPPLFPHAAFPSASQFSKQNQRPSSLFQPINIPESSSQNFSQMKIIKPQAVRNNTSSTFNPDSTTSINEVK